MPSETRQRRCLSEAWSFCLPAVICCLTALIFITLGINPAEAENTNCVSHLFMMRAPHPANTAYPDPAVNVDCTSSLVTVRSNGIPDYEFKRITPNPLQAQRHRFRFPLHPTQAARVSNIPRLGPIGVALNGIPLFGPNEGPRPMTEAWGDPVSNNILDICLGHTASGGVYHYHALAVDCIQKHTAEHDEVLLGFAFDGFPIYGPYGCVDAECTRTKKFQSSWEQIGNPKTDVWEAYHYVSQNGQQFLDECNGRVGPNGTYRYHATKTFPYILGCYHGVAATQERIGGDRGHRGHPRHRGRGRPPRQFFPPF